MSVPLFDRPFYFMRHGESEANAAERIAGSTDSPLTLRGRDQARRAAARLAGTGIAAIYASPQSRALDTARPVAETLGLDLQVIPDIRERHWGALELEPLSAITDRTMTAPEGESLADFEARTWAALAAIAGPVPALVVAHSGTMRVLRARLGVGDIRDWVGNAEPVRFDPPPAPGAVWRLTTLEGRPAETAHTPFPGGRR
ncbi:MAG: histidine phosphatase family protein [Alphaproteobacteria bacterium]|jgi:probable phosphoglycerate mutase|nr:histidine phosphatase family protein [Alphaproteobacteria bacterium]